MKILLYINCLCKGGAERVMVNLANHFCYKNEVFLVTSFPVLNGYKCEEKVKRINLFQKRKKGFLSRNFSSIRKLKKTIKTIRPDVAISFMAEPNFRLALATRRNKNLVTIISVRNDPNYEYHGFLFKLLAKILFKRVDRIVFQTDDAALFFSNQIKSKGLILPNAVDSSFFREPYRGRRKDIVSVGRLCSQKNHMLLIKAFAEVKDYTDDNLIIYGEGPERNELELFVQKNGLDNRVFLPGLINDVADKIYSAKLFVLSSNYEGSPNALMEAMALGVPCISTDCPCGGPHMLITDGINGFLVPTNNIESLSSTLSRVISVDLSDLSLASHQRMKDFLPERVFSQWEDMIISLLAERRKKHNVKDN